MDNYNLLYITLYEKKRKLERSLERNQAEREKILTRVEFDSEMIEALNKIDESFDDPIAPEQQEYTCVLCGQRVLGYPNAAWPLNDGECCDRCNILKVAPARLKKAIESQGQ